MSSSLEELLHTEGSDDAVADAQALMVLVIGSCMVTSLLGGSAAVVDRLPEMVRPRPL